MKFLLPFFLFALILAFTYAAEKGTENEEKKEEKTELILAKKEEKPIKPETKPNLIFQSKTPTKPSDGPIFTEKTGDGKEGRQKRWGYGGWGGYGGFGGFGGGCCGGWGGYGGYGGYGWGWGRRR